MCNRGPFIGVLNGEFCFLVTECLLRFAAQLPWEGENYYILRPLQIAAVPTNPRPMP
jgi:hypothetical protein